MSEISEEYPRISQEAVRKVRHVKRANREEQLIDLPQEETEKVGILPGDSVDVKAEGEAIVIRKLVPQSVKERPQRTYNSSHRNSPQ
jgi:hypothetical protein